MDECYIYKYINILIIQHPDPCNHASKFNRNPRCLICKSFLWKYRIDSSSEAGVIRIFVQTMYIYHELITNLFPMKFKYFAANLISNCQQHNIGNISNFLVPADLEFCTLKQCDRELYWVNDGHLRYFSRCNRICRLWLSITYINFNGFIHIVTIRFLAVYIFLKYCSILMINSLPWEFFVKTKINYCKKNIYTYKMNYVYIYTSIVFEIEIRNLINW